MAVALGTTKAKRLQRQGFCDALWALEWIVCAVPSPGGPLSQSKSEKKVVNERIEMIFHSNQTFSNI